MFRRLVIPSAIRSAMIAQAQVELPNECCGLLAGRIVSGDGIVAVRFVLRNELASPTEYLAEPRDLFEAMRAMRRDALDLLAIYHSHPHSAPRPSRADLTRNHWGSAIVHLIIGFAASAPELAAWHLGETEFHPAEWVVAEA